MPRFKVTVESPYDHEDDSVTFTLDTTFSRLVKRTASASDVLKAVCEKRNPNSGTVRVVNMKTGQGVQQRRKPKHPRRPYYARKPGAPIPRRRRRPRKPR